jgi:hypothetical protein
MTKLKCVLCWPRLYSLLTIIAFEVGAADATFGQEKPAEPAAEALNMSSSRSSRLTDKTTFKMPRARLHCYAARRACDRTRRSCGLEPERLFVPRKSGTRHIQSQSLAAGTAQPSARAVQSRRGGLSSSGHRPFQHDHSGRRYGIDRRRCLLSVETAKAALDQYYQLLFASGFTTSRAQSTNSFATGLRSRFFSVTRPIGLRVSGKSMGSAFSDPR